MAEVLFWRYACEVLSDNTSCASAWRIIRDSRNYVNQRDNRISPMLPQLQETVRLKRALLAIATCCFVAVALHDLVVDAPGIHVLRDMGLAVLVGALAYSAWTRGPS